VKLIAYTSPSNVTKNVTGATTTPIDLNNPAYARLRLAPAWIEIHGNDFVMELARRYFDQEKIIYREVQ
jgi:hypothetical protein